MSNRLLRPSGVTYISTLAISAVLAGAAPMSAKADQISDLVDLISSHVHVIPEDCDIGCATRPQNLTEWANLVGAISARGQSKSATAKTFSRKPPQVVVLDFEVGEPTFEVGPAFGGAFEGIVFTDHVYTQDERDLVQARLEADFAHFQIKFVQEVPTSGDFTFLQFNSNDQPGVTAGILPNGGILFGRASEIDFGNNNRAASAIIDANFWEFLFQIDPTGGVLSALSGIEINATVSAEDALAIAVINQTANTGAHELGHTLGLRHYDSFGAPGDGLPTSGVPAPGTFFPTYPGPQLAAETSAHTMASGASVGIGLEDSANADRFFSERSLIKLTINERGLIFNERHANGPLGQLVPLLPLRVRNTLVSGVNAGSRLRIFNAVVKGSIDAFDQVDAYSFIGLRNDVFNAEMISTVDINDDILLGGLSLYLVNRDFSLTLIAENSDEFESFDAFILDTILPKTGFYVLKAEAPNVVALDTDGDGVLEPIPLIDDIFGPGTEEMFRLGNYTLNLHMFDR